MNRPLVQTKRAKRGVALIVVLGFLSIMILMAVAFLTQARTERLVANSTFEAQRGRQLVRTALTAAMNDYSVDLWGQQLLLPPTNAVVANDQRIFTSFPPTALSAMPQDPQIGKANIQLMLGEARRWIPRRYLTPAVTNAVSNANWILVRENPSSQSRILGRYAYVCFDMSGGIDANLVALTSGVANNGNATNRNSVRDVGMGLLPETANASEFKKLRRGWHGFDSLAELILLTNGKYNGGEQQYADEDDETKSWKPPATPRWNKEEGRLEEFGAALTSSRVSDLVPYSLSAYRGVYDFAAAKWNKPQVCDATANWNQVLLPVGGQLASLADTVKTVQDYLDADSTPQGDPNYPSAEAVPMLNELGIRLLLEYEAATAQLFLNVELRFETWFPFPSDDNKPSGTFSIPAPSIRGFFTSPAEDIWIRCALLGGGQVNIQGSPSTPNLSFSADFNGGKPQEQGVIAYRMPVLPIDSNTVVSAASRLLVQFVRSQKPILLRQGGVTVDQMMFDAAGMSANLAVGTPFVRYMEVDDPRLNHSKDRWIGPAASGTMDGVNNPAQAAGYGVAGGEGLYMYCRNAAMMSPAELGFISTGNPWETIDLCTDEGVEMMSLLVADQAILDAITETGTYYTNGTINPSTSSSNVLMAAFSDLTTREVPQAPNIALNPLPAADAADLAGAMIAESRSKKIQETGGAFMSATAWARVAAMTKNGLLAGKGYNKNQRESLIRNTWGLFSPNDSLFTVLVVGQAIKEGPGQVGAWNENEDMITGERRGVALVWRDPFPSTGGFHHEMFVRMFKFLDE